MREIVRRAAENDESRRLRRDDLEHDQTLKTERLDESGKVLKTDTHRLVRRGKHTLTYATDEKVPTDKNADVAGAEQSLAVLNLAKMAPCYECKLIGEDSVQGRACYIVGYSPRPGQTAKTREEKVLNHLRGSFRIDKATFEILQGDGSLSEPVPVALVASITRMNFQFNTQSLPNGDAGPADFSMDLVVKAPLYYYRQKQSVQQQNWRYATRPAKVQ